MLSLLNVFVEYNVKFSLTVIEDRKIIRFSRFHYVSSKSYSKFLSAVFKINLAVDALFRYLKPFILSPKTM